MKEMAEAPNGFGVGFHRGDYRCGIAFKFSKFGFQPCDDFIGHRNLLLFRGL